MEYVPLWTAIIDEPSWKILDLPAEVYRFWTLCLLAAQKHDYVEGYLPDDRTLSAWIHMERDTIVTLRDMAVTGHVLERNEGGKYKVRNWEHWRDVKDKGATRRKRAERLRKKGLASSVTDESRNGHEPVTGVSHPSIQHSAFSIQQEAAAIRARAPACEGPPPPAAASFSDPSRGEEDAADWREALNVLRDRGDTAKLADEIEASRDPRIREMDGWRALVAAHAVRKPGKPITLAWFIRAAATANGGDLEVIEGKPGKPKPKPKRDPPKPKPAEPEPPEDPAELREQIARLEAMPRRKPWDETALMMAKETLAALVARNGEHA